ncbi:GAF domain-containing protein [Phormidium tenue]|uniref:GAF domain-containing protein n=1 Tax=Phormidium tenue FACHB-1050 TaxID=2692857 RepID=A0ABR8CE71_9CYAN|nr:GAF domain-containing protein [Phormidium tenue]MBD2318001.1 GAF domain-containing protein [Phormidium tenue FACHB-1050]
MDSTLLDQIRHLCRDRAAYEHLKAILVQQERVHQLSWEERYEKLISAQSTDAPASDIFRNIIAREKALAQLADAIQRSPSLDLVLQIAVQVAQKLLQVDRVAIFRCHPDGRGEFVTDAIATGLISLAAMPERQLSLARHMIESTNTENSTQTIDSIRTSSLSSHIVTLLEQIGISFYAANKIYAGQEVWGTLVAFHGSAYHSWSDSDRTSLSLIAAQIGIAISLTNLRQQSQELTDDLQTLQVELDNLQQTVAEIAESATHATITPDIASDSVPSNAENAETNTQEVGEKPQNDHSIDNNSEPEDLELKVSQIDHNLEDQENELEESESEEIDNNLEEIAGFEYKQISRNGLPPLFLIPDSTLSLSEVEDEDDAPVPPAIASNQDDISADITPLEPLIEFEKDDDITPFEPLIDFEKVVIPENITPVEPAIKFEKADISYVIMPDNLKVISVNESEEVEPTETELDETSVMTDSFLTENPNPDSSLDSDKIDELEASQLAVNETEVTSPEANTLENAETEIADSQLSQSENLESENLDRENPEPEAIAPEAAELETMGAVELIASQPVEPETIAPPPIQPEEQQETQQIDVDITLGFDRDHDDDDEPAIEPQFMETILEIAGNDLKAKDFLLNVIDSYLEDTPQLIQAIDKALAVNDQTRLLQSLNALRSSSDYIGALTLSHQCRQLESAVRANYVVLIYACLSRVAIEAQRATDALRIARSHYKL